MTDDSWPGDAQARWDAAMTRLANAACAAHPNSPDFDCAECVRRYFRNLIASDYIPRQQVGQAPVGDMERLAEYLTVKARLLQTGYEDPLPVIVATVVADTWMVLSGVLSVEDFKPRRTP